LNLVIDASVLIKFYVPEILSDKAEELLNRVAQGYVMLLAPDLIYPEVGNILWKKQRMKELTRPEVEEITDAIVSLPLKIEASKLLLPLAIDIGIAYRITVYDALYISMARVYETKMITADRKLADAMAKTDLKEYVSWLGSHKW
jgi:predicted nucleic acid-binding protein